MATLCLIAVATRFDAARGTRDARVVDWDVIDLGGERLLFTIEGNNDDVYSDVLARALPNGTTIRVYSIAQDVSLDDLNSFDDGRLQSLKMNCIYQNQMAVAHPWLITVGQSDADEHVEVFVGAFRATDYHKAETRPYFLEYRNGVLVRKWTGSRLNCEAFAAADYVDGDGDGRDELRVVECNRKDGKMVEAVAYYRLYGFTPHRFCIEQ